MVPETNVYSFNNDVMLEGVGGGVCMTNNDSYKT